MPKVKRNIPKPAVQPLGLVCNVQGCAVEKPEFNWNFQQGAWLPFCKSCGNATAKRNREAAKAISRECEDCKLMKNNFQSKKAPVCETCRGKKRRAVAKADKVPREDKPAFKKPPYGTVSTDSSACASLQAFLGTSHMTI